MTVWKISITDEAEGDLSKLDKSIRRQVSAGIVKVSKSPLPSPNGYGKPLGNKKGKNLTGFFKIKYKGIGIRVVYSLVMDKKVMNIITVTTREDEECYELAHSMYKKYGDELFNDVFNDFVS